MEFIGTLLGSFLVVFFAGGFFLLCCAIFSSFTPLRPGWKSFRIFLLVGWLLTWPFFWINMQLETFFPTLADVVFPYYGASFLLHCCMVTMLPAVLIIFPMWVFSYTLYALHTWGRREEKIPRKIRLPLFYIFWACLFPLGTAFNGIYQLAPAILFNRYPNELGTLIYLFVLCVLIPLGIGCFESVRFLSSLKDKGPLKYREKYGHTMKIPSSRIMKLIKPVKGFFIYWKD